MPIYLNNEVTYKGAVLADREENGYHDSDFYAVVWDEIEQRCKKIEYNTTRFAGGGSCSIDATEEVKQKAQEWLEEYYFRTLLDKSKRQSKMPEEGKRVRVVRGRKVPHGTEGFVFLKQAQTYSPRFKNGWKQGPDCYKIGISLSDKREKNYSVEMTGDAARYITPYKNEEFLRVAKEHGGKWNALSRTWDFKDNPKEVQEIADKVYSKYADVAWTYARNVEVIDPEQYINEGRIKEQAKRLAAQRAFHAPFVVMAVCI